MLKRLAVRVLQATGLVKLFFYTRRNSVAIFMVHGVVDDGLGDTEWVPAWSRHKTGDLERTVNALRPYCRFISLDVAVDMLSGNQPILPNCVVLTFDDGYRNNLTCAYPVLKKYGIEPCFFLATGFLDNKRPYWIDRLDYALQQLDAEYFDAKLSKFQMRILLRGRDRYKVSFSEFVKAMKLAFADDWEMQEEIDRFACSLEEQSGKKLADIIAADTWSAILGSDEIRALSDEITVGSHTVDHVRAGMVSDREYEDQLKESRRFIEDLSGTECRHFCYPNGNFTSNAMRNVRKTGYVSAVTTESGLNRVGDDLFSLRRIALPRKNTEEELLLSIMRQMKL